MGNFRKLLAWQKAHALSIKLHAAFRGRVANCSPGFRAQLLRAAKSITDNLAEGCAKNSRRALASFADTAYSSGKEVENDLLTALDLQMLPRQQIEDLLADTDEVCRLCFGLTRIPPGAD